MADGNTGDNHIKPVDQTTGAAAPADKGDHTAKLQADSQPAGADKAAKPTDATTVKDTTEKTPAEKAMEKLYASTIGPSAQSASLLGQADTAVKEIASYVNSGKKETDTVEVKDKDGKVIKTETVADRVKELKAVVDKDSAAAVGVATDKGDKTPSTYSAKDVASLLQVARSERNGLAKELGVTQDKFSDAAIKQLISTTTDSGTTAKLELLRRAQYVVDQGKLCENAPAYARMAYASYKANGLTDPDSGMQKDKNGGLKPSQKDVVDAVQLLNEAGGNNKDLRVSKLYLQAVATVLPKLENSSAKVQTITTDLQNATVAGAKGDKVEQERLLKDAVAQADKTNTAAIAQMLRDPRFVASQRNSAVLPDLASNVVMSSTARLQYAQFLADNSRFAEAQSLALRVKTEVPEVMYGRDPQDPNKINYKESRFLDMAKLDQTLASSSTVQPNQIKNLLDNFSTAMTNGQIDSKDGVKGASDIIKDLYVAANKKTTEIAEGQKGIDVAQKDVDQRKADLATKKYLTDDAKVLEQKQIDREQAMIQQQKALLDADAKEAARLTNVVKLYDAGLDVSEEKRDAARTLLAQIKASDPTMAAMTDKDGKDTFFGTLDKAAQEPGWWDKNWRKVAYAGAIVAGAAVGALTFWSGPGALVFGAGTTAAIMASVGAGVTVGAITGGATFLGTHEALYHTGVISEKVNALKDFQVGASAGALGAVTMIGLPAMAAVGGFGGAAATGAAVEGGAVTGAAVEGTSLTTTLLNLGAQSVKIGAVSFAGALPMTTANYFAEDPKQRSLKGSALQLGLMTGIPMAMPFGSAALRGVGILSGAPGLSQAVPLLSRTNLVGAGVGIGLLQAPLSGLEWLKAYKEGPSYAYGPGNTASSEISGSTALFGPWGNIRGYQAYRQGDDLTGDRSDIQSIWSDFDPGTIQMDKMANENMAKPITNTVSEFTDAAQLGSDSSANPAAPDKPKQ